MIEDIEPAVWVEGVAGLNERIDMMSSHEWCHLVSQGGAVVINRDVVVGDVDTARLVQLDAVVAPLETLIPEVSLPGAIEQSHQLTLLDVPPTEESLPSSVHSGGFDVDME